MRVAERHAVADERLGGVGRAKQRVGARRGEALAVELEAAHEHGQRGERSGDVARAANTGGLSSWRSRL